MLEGKPPPLSVATARAPTACHRWRPIQLPLPVPQEMLGWGSSGGGGDSAVVLSLNEVLELNWLRKWLMCIMELRVALHKGVC